jgi:hypothetical protein
MTKEAGEEYKGHPTGDGNRGGFKSSRSTGLLSEAGPAGKIRERRSCPARDKPTLIPPNCVALPAGPHGRPPKYLTFRSRHVAVRRS